MEVPKMSGRTLGSSDGRHLAGFVRVLALLITIGVVGGCTGSSDTAESASQLTRPTPLITTTPTPTATSIPSDVPESSTTGMTLSTAGISAGKATYPCQLTRSSGVSSNSTALALGPVHFESLQAPTEVARAADVGLTIDDASLSLFRKSPITAEPFDGSMVITLSGRPVYFAYPWDGSWTSGSARLNLTPFLTNTMVLDELPRV